MEEITGKIIQIITTDLKLIGRSLMHGKKNIGNMNGIVGGGTENERI